MRPSHLFVTLGVLFGTIGCDQGTKRLAVSTLKDGDVVTGLSGTVRFLYAENRGGWGSLGADWPPVWKTLALTVVPTFFLLGLLVYALLQRNAGLRSLVGPTLIVGGGVGNLTDRVLHGHVVDFMWMGIGPVGTNIFNVADVALLVGIGLMLFHHRGALRTEAPPADPPVAPQGPAQDPT